MPTLTAAAQALAFVGMIGIVLAAIGAAVLYALRRRRNVAEGALVVAGGTMALYAALLLIIGATSRTRVIAPGEGKAFCEIDCHVLYDVTSAYDSADGIMVTVREQFDGTSVSRRRGDAPMQPGSRRFALLDTSGRRWTPTAMRMLDSAPLFASIRPGEARRARLAFQLPRDAVIAGLLVEDTSPISPLLIGHERSPLHQKTLLALPEHATRARAARAPSAPARQG